MSTRFERAVRGTSLLVLLSLFVSACSGAASNAPADAQGTTPAAGPTGLVAGATGAPAGQGQSQQGGAGSVEDGLGHPVNICTLLPAATVASITLEPITQASEDDTGAYKIYACDYTSTDGTSELRISVLAMDAAAGYDGDLQANQVVSVKQISGLGDKAFSGVGGVEALFGNVSITVSNLQSDDAAVTLIRTLQPKL
jgi:hypothetical protein